LFHTLLHPKTNFYIHINNYFLDVKYSFCNSKNNKIQFNLRTSIMVKVVNPKKVIMSKFDKKNENEESQS